MTGHLVGHLVRRGIQHAQEHYSRKQQYINRLEQDAQAYEDAGPEMEINPREFLPVLITGVVAMFIIWSLDYTIGQVMSSLAMIESPTRTAIVDSKPPPPYTDSVEDLKEPLLAEEDADVEVTVIEHKPITSSIRKTIWHLHRIGGFRARWRGLGLSILYHGLHGALMHLFAAFLGFGLVGEVLSYTFTSLGLARLHMAWTHSMIAYPSSKWWFRRLPARKQCKALLIPALVYALAQQATIILPIGVAFAMGVTPPQIHAAAHSGCHKQMAITGLRILAIPLTYAIVGLAVLLPASVSLTRIEATLLAEGEETIVPFDKAAITQDIDITVRGGCRKMFVQAWRSFDRSSRLRLIKLYVRMVIAQIAVLFVAVHLMIAEVWLIGGERLGIFFKSAIAQLKLMAIEAREEARAQAQAQIVEN